MAHEVGPAMSLDLDDDFTLRPWQQQIVSLVDRRLCNEDINDGVLLVTFVKSDSDSKRLPSLCSDWADFKRVGDGATVLTRWLSAKRGAFVFDPMTIGKYPIGVVENALVVIDATYLDTQDTKPKGCKTQKEDCQCLQGWMQRLSCRVCLYECVKTLQEKQYQPLILILMNGFDQETCIPISNSSVERSTVDDFNLPDESWNIRILSST
jgi:hypothetical protein